MLCSLSRTRRIFLQSVAACYAMAFSSLYTQIPGLYGHNGIHPVHSGNDGRRESFLERPTLVWVLRDMLELSHEHTLDAMCLAGTLLAVLAAFLQGVLGGKVIFGILWVLYLSLYQVGGVFLWFQWDILLLEVGFLCILIAPLVEDGKSRPWDGLNMELVRWLLFRMMFANGLVKLTSECPSWWGLTAMPLHYESQCLPGPLAWFAFNYLPSAFHRFSVASTFMIEIPMTFLFYAPTSHLRKFAYSTQVILMLTIMLTGNYNFFNLLFMTLCISLSDDSWWSKAYKGKKRNILLRLLLFCFNLGVISLLLYGFIFYFFNNESMKFEIKFNLMDLRRFIGKATPIGIAIGSAYLGFSVLTLLAQTLFSLKDGLIHFITMIVGAVFHILLAALIFSKSLPVFVNGLDGAQIPQMLLPLNNPALHQLNNLHIANSYGLFRRMTGEGGRPEVVLLGSRNRVDWEEIEFLYKPGNLSGMPSFVLPHQPRLDWQMWFIALQGKFHIDKWFVNLCLRLVQGKRDVWDLLDRSSNHFDERFAPKYIKAQLYHYHFTSPTEKFGDKNPWWSRELIDPEFIAAVDKDTLEYYTEKIELNETHLAEDGAHPMLRKSLRWIRKRTKEYPPHVVVWTISVLFLPLISKLIFTCFRGLQY
eukprot:TRINITY_DN6337_c0_g1_i1.p1 TRINITY_DN6337_c0_g1~~TRINITY_DN6337_c0_g1_i1.p1  ORF type:complete len:646 (-),score=91.53 TRINITY_DN6337_c0_g1_i1:88-2025(-)